MIKVSLILTTYNSAENLKKTLESIEKQDYEDIEIVIKDGLSTDGTLEIIKEYVAISKYKIVWTSGKDRGIFDAMNQGYRLSTGDVVAFFNDRFLKKDAVTRVVQTITERNCNGEKMYDGVHADLIYVRDGKVIRYWKMGEGDIRNGWMPAHPTLYLWRRVYEKYGLFNTNYRCSADYEFMVRILKDNDIKLAYIPQVLVEMFYGGTSSDGVKGYSLSLKEAHRALKENQIRGSFLIDIKRSLRVIMQFCKRKKIELISNELKIG